MGRVVAMTVIAALVVSVCACTSSTSSTADSKPIVGNRIPPGAGPKGKAPEEQK
jgi:hypothetical protein